MLVRIPPHMNVHELSRRLQQAGLGIVPTGQVPELRCRPEPERLTVRRWHQRPITDNSQLAKEEGEQQ